MRTLVILGYTLFLFGLPASGMVVRGTLLNDDEPYIVRGDDGTLYKVEWYGGSILFWGGDDVILTNNFGWGNMIDDDNGARVWVVPSQTPASEAVWPDGRKLLHPNQFVTTRVVNVQANDTLKLRSGPGTSFRVLAEIPANETNITAFESDQIWDGDTWWCPVEWKGLRGYVNRSYLPK
jgi:Bacterial SH3 domain